MNDHLFYLEVYISYYVTKFGEQLNLSTGPVSTSLLILYLFY